MTAFLSSGGGASASRFASRRGGQKEIKEGHNKNHRISENFFLSLVYCVFWEHLTFLELIGHPTARRRMFRQSMIQTRMTATRLRYPLEHSSGLPGLT